MISLRSYSPSDYPELALVLKEAKLFYQPIDSKKILNIVIKNDPDAVIVAVKDDQIIGTVSIEAGRIPLIFRLAVKKKMRHKGIGKKLMNEAERRLKARGFLEVNILVDSKENKLHNYYQKQGYGYGHVYQWMYKELL